jgi:hypothetical protein
MRIGLDVGEVREGKGREGRRLRIYHRESQSIQRNYFVSKY